MGSIRTFKCAKELTKAGHNSCEPNTQNFVSHSNYQNWWLNNTKTIIVVTRTVLTLVSPWSGLPVATVSICQILFEGNQVVEPNLHPEL